MLAAGVKNGKDHQIRIREKPLLCFRLCGLGSAGDRSKVPVARQLSQMIQADASQAGDFIFCEELLARLDSDHSALLTA